MASPANIFNKGTTYSTTATSHNVLNDYRSYNYLFTLSGLTYSDLDDPSLWRNSAEKYVVIKSSGKSSKGLTAPSQASAMQIEANKPQIAMEETQEEYKQRSSNAVTALEAKNASLVAEFNKRSPGRFDFYINNVEIDCVVSPNPITGLSFANKMTFDVIEPYSINGFLEALHTTAIATGFTNYASAIYLFKLNFVGYPDSENTPEPELINNTTKYYPVVFKDISVELTEKGTVYRCTVVPFTDAGFGNDNTIKKPLSGKGKTIQGLLTNMIDNLNKSNKQAAKSSTGNEKNVDEFAIEFPNFDSLGNLDFKQVNDIVTTEMPTVLLNNVSSSFLDIYEVDKEGKKTNYRNGGSSTTPSNNFNSANQEVQVQFPENSRIHEAITSIIRDNYLTVLLKKMKAGGVLDEYGCVPFFMVHMKIQYKAEIDSRTLKPFQKITYVVAPYKVHYSLIPGYEKLDIDYSKFRGMAAREYNYLYTGKNIDIINFKLNFNALYFQGIPFDLNNESVGSKNAAGPSNNVEVQQTQVDTTDSEKRETPTASNRPVAQPIVPQGGTGGPKSDDPYTNLARNFNDTVVNSLSMTTGELDIIGDPFYMSTAAIGNYFPEASARGQTVDAEMNHTFGQVPVVINFRNPNDINPNGSYEFDSNIVPFSGIYAVDAVKNTFNDGMFKQRLKLRRLEGQSETGRTSFKGPDELFSQSPDPWDTVAKDTSAGTVGPAPTKNNVLNSVIEKSKLERLGTAFMANIPGSAQSQINALSAGASALVAGASKLSSLFATKSVSAADKAKNSIPEGVDLNAALKQGVDVNVVGVAGLKNLPATQPPAVAPPAPVDQAYLDSIASQGPKALANAFGVNDISQISPSMIPADALAQAKTAMPKSLSPLQALLNTNSKNNIG